MTRCTLWHFRAASRKLQNTTRRSKVAHPSPLRDGGRLLLLLLWLLLLLLLLHFVRGGFCESFCIVCVLLTGGGCCCVEEEHAFLESSFAITLPGRLVAAVD